MTTTTPAIGTATRRDDAVAKVTGEAQYAGEIPLTGRAYGWIVQARVAKGRIAAIDTDAARNLPGVLDVLTARNAPRVQQVDDAETMLLQDDAVHYRGQVVAAVIAESLEHARQAADELTVRYDRAPHDVDFRADHPGMYTPDKVNPNFPSRTNTGDVDAALAQAAHVVDATYRTPAEHNNPMEPHTATAVWDEDRLTVYDSSQGVASVRPTLARLFGLEPDAVRVLSQYVGGGFGSKGSVRPPTVLAAMAARLVGRPVTVAATRQQMWAFVGYRTPTIQRMRLGADASGHLVAVEHTASSQTSRIMEFAEQTAVITRTMYATPNVRTAHRLVALDVPTPRWMRAPGEAPGSFALESAMDELAEATGIDPVELRIRNDTDHEPEGGARFTSRSLVACLRAGAARFGWADRDPVPGRRRDGRWLVGSGVASATYPARSAPSTATATAHPDGSFTVSVAAADIGTGARTALRQVAADQLGVDPARVRVLIADSDFGPAMIAGGSMGTASWGWAILKACAALRGRIAATPDQDVSATADTADDIEALEAYARHAFGAHFAEVRVDVDSGEIRVPRMVSVFAAGRIVNPTTARSQFLGGVTMGIGMALHEQSVLDPQFGDFVNHDLAGYHVPVSADIGELEIDWVDETDELVNPLGIKGIGEIGIVGAAAAVANAVWHATGTRQRDLPLTPDRIQPTLCAYR
jgi:xanthine dehydrogenase YagR molybdenum-binding subunit